jgi:hypothetical protein
MKKYYILISSFCATIAALSQTKVNPQNIPLGPAQTPVAKVTADLTPSTTGGVGNNSKPLVRRGNLNYTNQIRIGSTYYDLQSNYAQAHRIILNNDGSVSVTWTSSPNPTTNFPQRGSGFNFRNSSGVWGPPDSIRCEGASQRTGWPSIGRLSNGNEFVIGHDASVGGFYMTKATSPGAKPSVGTLLNDLSEYAQGYKPIWARMANNGDTIHMIYSYTDSAAPGEKRSPTRKGIFAPMVYSRSLNGGASWDIKHIMLPNYDSTVTNNGGADQYAIDVRGNTVAIVNADNLQGVIAWKSTDFGTTFKRLDPQKFKYAPYNAKKLMPDTPTTNDGTVDVIIDKNNKMHVFWGLGRVLDTDTTDASYSFFPGIQGIGYWSEITDSSKIIASGAEFDRTGDNVNTLEQATFSALTTTGLPSGLGTVARLGNTSAMRQPSAAIDNNGNIYCTFSVPIEQDVSDLGANFRDLGVVYSKNSGASWSASQNITQVLTKEDDFGNVARKANGFLHVTWQQDDIPGTNLQNNSTNDGNHQVVLNFIRYQAIPVTEILNNTIGMVWGLGVDKPNTGEVMVVNQNFPNPFSGTTNVLIYLTRPGDVNISVHNMAGAEVLNQTSKGLMRGNHILEINASGLATGVYTYTLTSGGSTVSKTMVVK